MGDARRRGSWGAGWGALAVAVAVVGCLAAVVWALTGARGTPEGMLGAVPGAADSPAGPGRAAGSAVERIVVEGPAVERTNRSGRSGADGARAWEPAACWVELAGERVSCGWVRVPLAEGSRVSLRVAVLRVAPRRRGAPLPPLLYLGGGPGHSVIARLSRDLRPLLSLAEERELIFVDPRGTGFGRPTLECRESGPLEDSLRRCHERQSVDVDPSEFTTAAGVRDVEAVRRALGIERWDVLGTSHGARWALTALRDAPQAVRAVVLDSPVPLEVDLIAQLGSNAQRALDRLAELCAAQPPCAEAFPSPRDDLLRVAAELREAPLRTSGTVIDVDRFVRGVLGLLYAPARAAYLPQLLHRAAAGDFEPFLQLEAGLAVDEFFLGAHLSVQCAEEAPFTSLEAIQRADQRVATELRAVLSGRSYLEDCRLWKVRPAAARENVAVRSEHPVLILSGELDPVTPPDYAEAVRANLPAARWLRVRGASHGLATTACGLRWIDAFTRAPEKELSLDCPDLGVAAPSPLAPTGELQVELPLRFLTSAPDREELERLQGTP